MKNITLEMSLKPFKETTDAYIKTVCEAFFMQWRPLIKNAPQISVMLWTADGSEILEYKGNLDESFEWCYLIGGANPRRGWNKKIDPDGLGLHTRNYLYMDNPPTMTYGILKKIISTIKSVGRGIFPNKIIRVGETFDPGPEFAKSDFKYNRHNEICLGESMGKTSMVCAYNLLHSDNIPYAGFKDGIPADTPFGTFFGRQSQIFLSDMGFDYIWLSNGLGFGVETWGTTGAIFNGGKFDITRINEVKEKVLNFWSLFRKECPDFPVEVRGTNLSMGIDMSTDGVPLKSIYENVSNILPPPNSPWAALDGDFGLELMGHMSRICETPNGEYLFRYYLHDPWWVNSPWYDRYGGQPHDIYLPLSVAVVNENGDVKTPTHLNILTIDNSYGDMPDNCVNEPLPHILKALKDSPDDIAPLVWIYPFREYSECKNPKLCNEMFYSDWFIRNAINDGFPLNMVVSTDNFIKTAEKNIYNDSIMVTTVPKDDTEFEVALLKFIEASGKVLLYGNIENKKFQKLLNIKITDEISGILKTEEGKNILHDKLMCAGGINTEIADENSKAANVFDKIENKVTGIEKNNVVWVRGTNSCSYKKNSRLLIPHNPNEFFAGEVLMRRALEKLGYKISFTKENDSIKSPVFTLSKSNGALILSVYSPNTTVKTELSFPLGAPVLLGYEAAVKNTASTYHFPKSDHKECRIFVEQSGGIVGARELPPVSYQIRRRIEVSGLENATVRFLPESYCRDDIKAALNSHNDNYFTGDDFSLEYKEGYWEAAGVTGSLVFSMPLHVLKQ